jgi:DNA repair exonuclease SbcCD ATPase subunit
MKKKELKRQIEEITNQATNLENIIKGLESVNLNLMARNELLKDRIKELEEENENLRLSVKGQHEIFWNEKKQLHKQIASLESQLLEVRNTKPTYIIPIEALEQLKGLEKPNPTVGGPGSCTQKSAEELDQIQKTVQRGWENHMNRSEQKRKLYKEFYNKSEKPQSENLNRELLIKFINYADEKNGMWRYPIYENEVDEFLQSIQEKLSKNEVEGNPV